MSEDTSEQRRAEAIEESDRARLRAALERIEKLSMFEAWAGDLENLTHPEIQGILAYMEEEGLL